MPDLAQTAPPVINVQPPARMSVAGVLLRKGFMNDKTAKHLRRQAREMTQGRPERAYIPIFGRGDKRNRVVSSGVRADTTRGVYRRLKKEARA